MTIVKCKTAEWAASSSNNISGDKVGKMVNLMANWKNAHKAMGCPVKAAYSCPEFEEFLDQKERKQMHRYH